MSDNKPSNEPSIEEILGSIRRIIADDEEQPVEQSSFDTSDDDEDDDAPLELTQKIDEDGTVIDLQHDEPAADRYDDADDNAEAYAPPTHSNFDSRPTTASREINMINFDDNTNETNASDPLVSSVAASATAAVMAKLARNTALNRQGNDGLTIEDLVKDMLRPMLREWLDENLPEMVQAMVERELEKISRRVG